MKRIFIVFCVLLMIFTSCQNSSNDGAVNNEDYTIKGGDGIVFISQSAINGIHNLYCNSDKVSFYLNGEEKVCILKENKHIENYEVAGGV